MVRRVIGVLFALLVLAPAQAAAHGVSVHGDPAAALPDSLITRPVAQAELSGSVAVYLERFGGLPEAWCGTETTEDTPGGTDDPHFKVVYAYAAGQPNRFADLDDKLQASVSLLSRYVAGQSGGAKTLRFDMGTGCGAQYADIETVALPEPLSYYVVGGAPQFARLAADVRAASPLPPGSARNLLVYADALRGENGVAGAGETVLSDVAGPHDEGGRVAAAFGHAEVPSGTYADPATLMHEAAHNLGAVQASAPHSTGAGHCSDERDVMCYDDGGPTSDLTYPCASRDGEVVDETLDCGGDDYFSPAPDPSSYLGTHWNLYDSAHLAECSEVACGIFDETPPDNTTPAPPTEWLTAPYEVQLSATDAGSGLDRLQWRIGTGAEHDAADGETVTVPGEGVKALWTRAIDRAGNESEWRSDSVRIDTVAPVDSTTVATTWSRQPVTVTPAAADATSGVERLEWRLGDGPVQTGSQVVLAGDGEHTVRTRAVDVAGNASAWRTHTVRVDSVTPTDATAAPAGWQTAPLAVSVQGADEHSGIAEVRWQLDGGSQQTGASPRVVTVAGDGEHTLRTRVVDRAGNVGGWTDHSIRIDTTAPVNETPAADGAWRASDYAVVLAGADGGSQLAEMQWRLDGGPEHSGPSGSQATVSGTGTHTLQTRAVDVAGNASTWRSETLRIDRVAPVNTTAAAPSGAVPNPYRVAVTGTDAHAGVAEVQWQVDDAEVQSGASGTQVTVEGHGTHTLRTRLVDGAGNASVWRVATVRIDVALNNDTTAPVDTTTTVASTWRTAPVVVTVSATDAGAGMERVQWRIQGQPVQTIAGAGGEVTISEEGAHVLETRAWDRVGNVSAWRAQTVRLDFTVPADTTVVPSSWQASRTITAAGADAHSGVESIEYRIGSGSWRAAAPGAAVDTGADGVFVIEHRAIDHAGHASALRTDTLRVDTVAPVNTSAVPPSVWRDSALAHVLAGTDERSGLAGMQWRVGDGPVQEGGPAVVDTDGVHVLSTRAVDVAGNGSAWRTGTVRVDVTDPVNDTPAPPAGWISEAYAVQVAGSDGAGSGVTRVEWQIGEGPVSVAPDALVSGDGVHTLKTRVVDGVARASEWRVDTIRIDTVDPVVTVDCEAAWSARPVECAVDADGGPSGVARLTVAHGDGEPVPVVDGSVVVEEDGEHELSLEAVDGAGNAAVAEATVRVDRSAPVAGVACSASGTGYVCRPSAADAVSGVAAVGVSVNGGAWKPLAGSGSDPWKPFTVAHGTVRLRVVDAAGNATVTAPLALADRTVVPKPPAPEVEPEPRIRTAARPVYLRGGRGASAMVGALHATRDAEGTVAVDLRPLAVGPGRYQVKLRIAAGKRTENVTRVRRVRRGGALPRLRAQLTGARSSAIVTLVVRRRTGDGWRAHAGARLVLARPR
jgi:hypothetical protein